MFPEGSARWHPARRTYPDGCRTRRWRAMLDVRRLRLLVELSRRGTLAAVAEALAYSPSSVSQQLSQLEKEVGVPLLVQVGRRVQLTPQAELLVGHAEAVIERLEEAEADVARSLTTVSG